MRSTRVAATLVILISLSLPAASGAHGNTGVFGFGTAVVDGVVEPSEWGNAGRLDLLAQLPEGGTMPATLRMMNDANSLYISLTVGRASMSDHSIALVFDNDHDGSPAEDGDDGLALGASADPGLDDNVRSSRPPCATGRICAFRDTDAGGTTDGAGAFSIVGDETHFEISHPLDSADDLNDFSLGFGETIGFDIQYVIFGSGGPHDTHLLAPGQSLPDFTVLAPVDRTLPETWITAGPESGAVSALNEAQFAFVGVDEGDAPDELSFYCALDEAPFSACSSEHVVSGLSDGEHVFSVFARDRSDNTDPTPAERRWIVDTTAPELSVSVDQQRLWPPNHKLVPISVTVEVSDANGASAWLEAVASEDPEDVVGADLGTLDEQILLRAERRGDEGDRVYVLTYAAEDGAGNRSTASAEVVVPHDGR